MTDDRPRIDNAPGLTWRRRGTRWEARWRCRPDLAKRGYRTKTVSLWKGTAAELADADRAWIADMCNGHQADMLVWGRGGVPELREFDGTLGSLIGCYQTDPDSTFHKLRYRSRKNQLGVITRLAEQHGATRLEDIKARTLLRWHEAWSASGHVAMPGSFITRLRTLVGFGFTILEDAQCQRLVAVLGEMKFKWTKPREDHITAEQAAAVCAAAHQAGRTSIALAQAFQFECTLRQKDVIGEWVPMAEPGTSEVTNDGRKWLHGLRWSEIDANLILRHITSKRGKMIEVDLNLCPMVMGELARLPSIPTAGPVIISETTGRPYSDVQFRVAWRRMARAAGVPDLVFNMDSRAGAITEATAAGATLEDVRHAATHSDIKTTARYSRGSAEKTATVLRLRAVHRGNKK